MAGAETDEVDAPSRPATLPEVLPVSATTPSDEPAWVGTVLVGAVLGRVVAGAALSSRAVLGPSLLSQPAAKATDTAKTG